MDRFSVLSLISDGYFYDAEDEVLADSCGCTGCSYCCENMCDAIVIDPYDLYALSKGLGKDYSSLISDGQLEVGLHDCLTLPHIKDSGAGCSFLTEKKRCSIHDIRPGFCRLFPLGRFYHDNTFSYILQIRECKKEERKPVKVRDWLGIPELEKYEEYANKWHYFIKGLSKFMIESKDYETKKLINDKLLNLFYEQAYDTESDFYDQLYLRMKNWEA